MSSRILPENEGGESDDRTNLRPLSFQHTHNHKASQTPLFIYFTGLELTVKRQLFLRYQKILSPNGRHTSMYLFINF